MASARDGVGRKPDPNARGDAAAPERRGGALGTRGHVTTKASSRALGALYKSGGYAQTALCLTLGDRHAVRQRGDRSAEASEPTGRQQAAAGSGGTRGRAGAVHRHRSSRCPSQRGGVQPRLEPRDGTRRVGRRAGCKGSGSGGLAARPPGEAAHGPWRISRSPALALALPGSAVDGRGLPRRQRGTPR
jgi:hypothetical protein